MKINIKNYKNISSLEIKLQKNKINYLFGMSGSGKTSFGESLTKELEVSNVKVGLGVEDVEILVNNIEPNVKEIKLFNQKTVEDLLMSPNMNNQIYDIVFGDTTELETLKNLFRESIAELAVHRESIYIFKNDMELLQKELTGKILKDRKDFAGSGKINKLMKDLSNIDNEEYLKELVSYDSSHLNWKISGSKLDGYYEKGVCPFCEVSLTEKTKEYIDMVKSITPANFEAISKSRHLLEKFDIKIPNNFFDISKMDKFKENLINITLVSIELDKVLSYLNYAQNYDNDPSTFQNLTVNDILYTKYPEFKDIILNLNNELSNLKIVLGKMKETFNKTINKNTERVNVSLERLGIPYIFKVDNYNVDKKEADFKLFHKDDESFSHRVEGLSFGEKNSLSLLLFLLINDKSPIIIDDPASSYDEYRRKVIFDLLYEFQNDRTIVVLSHDHVFTKFAIWNYENSLLKQQSTYKLSLKEKRFLNNTGNVYFLENYTGCASIKSISNEDFKPIEVHVLNHLSKVMDNASYYRKILNLRILSELKKYNNNTDRLLYSFLSGLLHKQDKCVILESLEKKGVSEKEILELIKKTFGIKLEPIPDNYENEYNDENEFTFFEKIILLREEKNLSESVRDELNNIVHLTDAYAIQLNPYKFNYFSPYVYNMVKNNDENLISKVS